MKHKKTLSPVPVHPCRKFAFMLVAVAGLLGYQLSGLSAPKSPSPLGNGNGNGGGNSSGSNAGHLVKLQTQGLPPNIAISVKWWGKNNGGNPTQGPSAINSSDSAPQSLGNMDPGSSFTVEFPLEVQVIDKVYRLVGTSPTSPFTVGPGHGSTTIVGTYQENCRDNDPPTLTADDYEVPDRLCATWDPIEQKLVATFKIFDENVDESLEDNLKKYFNADAGDPDGDPVTITVDVLEVTLAGIGKVEATVMLTVTDHPSNLCPGLTALSFSVPVKVIANLTFDFVGFETPLSMDEAVGIKGGRTVPVKFRLFDCAGTEICSMPEGIANHIEVYSASAPTTPVVVEDSGASNENTDLFRYEDPCGEGTFIYNLSTKAFEVGESYEVNAVLADGTTHSAVVTVTK